MKVMKRRSGSKTPLHNHRQQHDGDSQYDRSVSLNLVVFQADLFGAHNSWGVSGLTFQS
jgi:hypothetical protein